jgi:hypothetical protein
LGRGHAFFLQSRWSDLIADLDVIESAAAEWRTNYAEPVITSVVAKTHNVVSSEMAEQGKAEFDHLRELFDIQNSHLVATRTHAITEV